MDPLAGSPWSRADTVAGFTASPPNADLIRFAEAELGRSGGRRLLDIGCGAGRNAVPLAAQGWRVLGVDLSLPMVLAAHGRALQAGVEGRLRVALAPMDRLPVRDRAFDLVVAHGIWNLARSAGEFRRGVADAARSVVAGGSLFVFTFSRHTLPPDATPVPGEPFVFTQFSGEPQCFLTEEQLIAEMGAAGFEPEPAVPLTELNRPKPGALGPGRVPVIYQAAFRLA